MASASSASHNNSSNNAGTNSNTESNENEDSAQANFECNICLDTAKDAVVSFCGHLFCWPCLHTWLETRPNNKVCPVCKAAISRDKVIPLYGRGCANQDPREKTPPRPSGIRSEPENQGPFQNFWGDNFQVSFGIGAFPFGYFSTNFGTNHGADQQRPQTEQEQNERFLSEVFFMVVLISFFFLMLA
ncbi:E3 ubiquitin-protein ligase RNF185 [Trichoplax sp. H2]|uniref:RING-type E3 ubiquitin transferase n=1 Tax=Trichoplax adhaerens TaxID=10228 RepID=B3S596_TRIAD|nr:hypothetical protein TRIADDRAFT_50677 [Trichoplax adhaerens]EDV22225.1 hypothetical protein TRIADDRAFT_50677 [Trichoplax adhaerens]RDD46415.1 E3 ubiquitin-protein ligase RNF185 [Trichoplax sp. H2]|eukprot:XP_002115380.1 hypothetical protein TRIADDRAFT_50677 [Trichoplax adhaerens]